MARFGEAKFGEVEFGAERTLTANVKSSVAVSRSPLIYKFLRCEVIVMQKIRRAISKNINCIVPVMPNIRKNISKALSAVTAAVSAYASKATFKTISAAVDIAIDDVKKKVFKTFTVPVLIAVKKARTMFKTITSIVDLSSRVKCMMAIYKQLFPRMFMIEYPVSLSYINYEVKLEVTGMPKAGGTITLRGEFPDSAGDMAMLSDVTVKIYGPGKVLLETINEGNITKIDTGIYEADYTIPEDKFGQFDYEFSGIIGNKTVVGRGSFDSVWK
jgi:hypothetical protein